LRRFLVKLLKNPVLRVFAMIMLVALVGGLIVMFLEERSPDHEIRNIGEAIWWAIVTMTTVGYGDYTPQSGFSRVMAVIIMFAGLSLISILTGTIASIFVARRLRAGQGLMPVKIKDHVIICGWHHKLETILNALTQISDPENPVEIVLINEESEDRVQTLRNQYGINQIKFVRGEFTRETILKLAGLEQARSVIILPYESPTRDVSDERTILATLTIKNMNPKVEVVAYVSDQKSITHVKRANADAVVLADNFSSFIVASHILTPGISEAADQLLDSRSPRHFQRASIPRELVGHTFNELLLHNREKNGWLTIGLFTEEEQIGFGDFLSADTSALDAFIERKLREAGKGLEEGSRISVVVNPPGDHVIQEGEGAIVIP
jgi:voltage-gated potassium channel